MQKTVPRIGGNSLRKIVQTKITLTKHFQTPRFHLSSWSQPVFLDKGTPWKINRWTLKVIPIEKPNHLPNPPFLCSMFIFQSKPKPINISQILPQIFVAFIIEISMSCSDNKPLGRHFCFNKRSHCGETRKPKWQGSIFWRKRYFFFLRVSQNCTLKSFQNRVEHINYQNFCLSFQNVEPVTPIGNPSPTLFRKKLTRNLQ